MAAKARRQTAIEQLSTEALQTEIARRERHGQKLLRRRERLAEQLHLLDQEIISHKAVLARSGKLRVRPRNKTTLPDALAAVLRNKTMSVADAVVAVQKAGYQSNAKNFRTVVSIALIKSGQFKRVSRGMYTAKAKAEA